MIEKEKYSMSIEIIFDQSSSFKMEGFVVDKDKSNLNVFLFAYFLSPRKLNLTYCS